jgi:FkbM family methyltransferase
MIDAGRRRSRMDMFLMILVFCLGLLVGKRYLPREEIPGPAISTMGHVASALDGYSPNHFSGKNEELIIRHFFRDRRGGFFLDVGAFHYKNGSNTYYLEKFLDWKGIAIDANKEFAQGYRKNRPGTRFYWFFVSDRSDEKADFYIVRDPKHPGMSSAIDSFVKGLETERVVVPSITLDDLLTKIGVEKINFLSMDIELSEPRALSGFDINKFKPELVCIEAHRQVRDQIYSYFVHHGYKRLDLYFLFDTHNWYFVPEAKFETIFNVSF